MSLKIICRINFSREHGSVFLSNTITKKIFHIHENNIYTLISLFTGYAAGFVRINSYMNSEVNYRTLENLFQKEIYSYSEQQNLINFYNEEGQEVTACKLVILIKSKEEKPTDEEISMIRKMILWIGLSASDVVVINLLLSNILFIELHRKIRAENVIGFNVLPADIGLQIESVNNRLQYFLNCGFIFTSSLTTIKENETLKNEFFNGSVASMFKRQKDKKM
ncbi:MAG: hypothetical protein H0W62_06595 [Chitinophagales bacterium]|nr:hypothetical protein [Chitinophagales bacterium]